MKLAWKKAGLWIGNLRALLKNFLEADLALSMGTLWSENGKSAYSCISSCFFYTYICS